VPNKNEIAGWKILEKDKMKFVFYYIEKRGRNLYLFLCKKRRASRI